MYPCDLCRKHSVPCLRTPSSRRKTGKCDRCSIKNRTCSLTPDDDTALASKSEAAARATEVSSGGSRSKSSAGDYLQHSQFCLLIIFHLFSDKQAQRKRKPPANLPEALPRWYHQRQCAMFLCKVLYLIYFHQASASSRRGMSIQAICRHCWTETS